MVRNEGEEEMRKSCRGIGLAALAVALAVHAARAQEGDVIEGSGDAGEEEEYSILDQVIVTATGRSESLQDVPIAVSAIGGERLEASGFHDIADLQDLTPGFDMAAGISQGSSTILRIRGIGSPLGNPGIESSVGVFLDGVYLSRPGAALAEMPDVEQIEILRGPQSTLFGRNTVAGALSIRSRAPNLSEKEFFGNVTAGNYGAFSTQLVANLPIVEDQLGLRVSGSLRKSDGYLESVTSNADSYASDRYFLRGQLLWTPTPEVGLRIIADYSNIDEHCCSSVIIQDTVLANSGLYQAAGLPGSGVLSSGRQALEDLESNGNAQSFETSEQYGISAELEWDLGAAELTYLAAYRSTENENFNDADETSLDVYLAGLTDEYELQSHELRLHGQSGRLDWLIGAYYSDEQIREGFGFGTGADATAYLGATYWYATILGAIPFADLNSLAATPLATGGTFGDTILMPSLTALAGGAPYDPMQAFAGGVSLDGASLLNDFRQDGTSFSIFTHNEFDVTEKLQIVAGLRYIREEKEGGFEQLSGTNNACLTTAFNAASIAGQGNLTANPFGGPDVPVGSLIGQIGLLGACLAGPYAISSGLGLQSEYQASFEDDALTGLFSLVYRPSDRITTYATYSRGYKSGGVSLQSSAASQPTFANEDAESYELGVKSTLIPGRLQANLALYSMDVDGFQQSTYDGLTFNVFNALVESDGVELEVFASPVDELDINLALTYADTRYPDNCAAGLDPVAAVDVADLCGLRLPNAPLWSSVIGANWVDNLGGSSMSYFVGGDVVLESSRAVSEPLGGVYEQSGTAKLNLRAGLGAQDDRWGLEIWGDNIFDERVMAVNYNLPGRGSGPINAVATRVAPPRTYGVTLRFRF